MTLFYTYYTLEHDEMILLVFLAGEYHLSQLLIHSFEASNVGRRLQVVVETGVVSHQEPRQVIDGVEISIE